MEDSDLPVLLPRKAYEDDVRVPPLPADYSVEILYKDEEIVIVNKPYDIRVDGRFSITLEKLVRKDFPEMDKFRMCNQLDCGTSGAMVLGRSNIGTRNCNKLFLAKKSQKYYLAMGQGSMSPDMLLQPVLIRAKLFEPKDDFRVRVDEENGKECSTIAMPLKICANDTVLFLIKLLTGRRHQIRLHLKHIGYPIVGDWTYGERPDEIDRMMLHAWKLSLPYSDEKIVSITAPAVDFYAAADISESELEQAFLDSLDTISSIVE
jgi:23S rRNA-/tRNA-specific pseudouridylate synthase